MDFLDTCWPAVSLFLPGQHLNALCNAHRNLSVRDGTRHKWTYELMWSHGWLTCRHWIAKIWNKFPIRHKWHLTTKSDFPFYFCCLPFGMYEVILGDDGTVETTRYCRVRKEELPMRRVTNMVQEKKKARRAVLCWRSWNFPQLCGRTKCTGNVWRKMVVTRD